SASSRLAAGERGDRMRPSVPSRTSLLALQVVRFYVESVAHGARGAVASASHATSTAPLPRAAHALTKEGPSGIDTAKSPPARLPGPFCSPQSLARRPPHGSGGEGALR